MERIRICPNEKLNNRVAKHIKCYYKGYEIPYVYALELSDVSLEKMFEELSNKRKNTKNKYAIVRCDVCKQKFYHSLDNNNIFVDEQEMLRLCCCECGLKKGWKTHVD